VSFYFLILIALIGVLLPTAYAAKTGAPYVPTFSKALANAFRQLQIGPSDLVIDLGAGDGKVLLAASASGAKALGYELSPPLFALAWWRCFGQKNIKLKLRNFYAVTLPPETTIVFLFLVPQTMQRARKYLLSQSLPRLRYVLSYAFPFPDVVPRTIIHTPRCARLFVYRLEDLK
jgi:hypothetical protein